MAHRRSLLLGCGRGKGVDLGNFKGTARCACVCVCVRCGTCHSVTVTPVRTCESGLVAAAEEKGSLCWGIMQRRGVMLQANV